MHFLQETWRDIQFGARLLRKAPAFTIVAISTLGLALGVNAAVFSSISALLLKPLPFGTPENQLVLLWGSFSAQRLERVPFSAPEVNDLRERIASFEEAAAFRHMEYNLTQGGEPERVFGAVVSWNLFSVLRAAPKLGRAFTADDVSAPNGDVVVISESLWERRFASDPDIVGKQVSLSGRDRTVIGVMPAAFRFPLALFDVRGPVTGAAEIWEPTKTKESSRPERGARINGVIARMRGSATLPAANAELARMSEAWREQYPESYEGRGFSLRAHSLRGEVVGRMRSAILIAGMAVFILWLIALANLVALLLARAKSREQELAARIALGAGPRRLFRQFLTEGVVISVLAAAAAFPFASAALLIWRLAIDPFLSLGSNVRFYPEVPICIVALSVLSGLLLGIVPGLRIAARAAGDRSPLSHRTLRNAHCWERVRDGLVIGETALALVLLVAAGSLAKSYLRLRNGPLGFNPAKVLTLEISLPGRKYSTDPSVANFFSTAASEIGRAPGINSAAFTSVLPLSGINTDMSFTVEGGARVVGDHVPDEEVRIVTADYFAALEIPVLRGRAFTGEDNGESVPVVVINQALAGRYWPGVDPVGKRIRLNHAPSMKWMEVVGVVGDIKHRGLDEPGRPEFYLPHAQMPSRLMTLVARINRPEAEVIAGIRERVRAIDPEQPIANVRLLDRVVALSVAPRRVAFVLVAAFAVMSLFLAAAGVYGVISYRFAERRRDLAMRIALGASRRAILTMVYQRAFLLVGAGALLGLPIALAANQRLAPLLYNVSPHDPVTFLGVLTLLLSLGVIATFIPARRAARLNAMPLLRCD